MKNLVLKMVARKVVTSNEGNKLLNLRKGIDPVWKGLTSGAIDEKKLASFYEQEGYPVIYDEGNKKRPNDYFSRFFSPDFFARYLVYPISFKKESKDIILGFINSSYIDKVRDMIQMAFPDFNTTFFHVPYSLFKRVLYRDFMFDIESYLSHFAGKEAQGRLVSEVQGTKGSILQILNGKAETVYLFSIEGENVIYKDETMINRFPLTSLPTIQEGIANGYLELTADSSIKRLSHTEKIVLFTNMGIKREDRITVISKSGESYFYFLINPRVSRRELEAIVNA